MRIFISGSSGFLGTHLIKKLGGIYKIIPFDLKKGFDILDNEKLENSIKNCDVVVHLAAYISSEESWLKPRQYFENNAFGSFNIIKAAAVSGVKRVINISSAAVYADPLSPYGASKLWAETAGNIYKDRLQIVNLRPFNLYGKGQNPEYTGVIQKFMEDISKKGEITVYGDGKQSRDFISVNDVVGVIEYFIESQKFPDKPVDVGTGKSTEILELARIIGQVLDKSYKINFKPGRRDVRKSKAKTQNLLKSGIDTGKFRKLDEGLQSLATDLGYI